MRRQLVTSDPSELCAHDHVAWCGDGPDALHRLAVSAFSEALKRGERMLFVSEQPDPAPLADLGDLEALLDRGALQLTTVEEAYREISDAPGLRARFEEELDRALAYGYSGSWSRCSTSRESSSWITGRC